MKKRIMIVDDEPAIIDAIQYALETEGFCTERQEAGIPVLAALAERPADLVLLDIGLPDCSGLELFREIRRDSAVPIIFLTARNEEIDRVVGLELGADDYIAKPFSPREVAARVKAVLRRTGSGRNAPVSNRIFSVDEAKRRIVYHGSALDLSRYEFDILSTLLRRPGHVFSRERLMDLVWAHPEASLDRTIDAHIKNIRAKLKRIRPQDEPILTHRGLGYAMRDDL
jgi:two-component system, OmpR family, catabolic regulation response regulator CreB